MNNADKIAKEYFAALETDIETHIQSCQECMGRTEFERQLKNRLKETGDSEVPPTLNKRLKSIIDDL